MPEPIADLSYRGYRGAHLSEGSRWKIIARMGWRMAFRKRSFWVFSSLAAWYYVIMAAFLYVIEQAGITKKAPEILESLIGRIVWKDQFLTGFSWSQMIWLTLGLMVGAGAIANDNGTNALLVYLSKPCRKIDYLFGKWMGVFVPLLVGMTVPTAFFYLYGLLNFRDYGFVTQDPWLHVRLAVLLVGAAAFQTSIILGVSSLFNKGRMAGAAYSAVFFLLTFFTFLMWVAFEISREGGTGRRGRALGDMAEKLNYVSIDGLQNGLAKIVLGTNGSQPFSAGVDKTVMHAPPPMMIILPMVLLSAGGIALAWKRIRAVEVVK